MADLRRVAEALQRMRESHKKQVAESWQEKLKTKGVKQEEICVTDSVFKLSTATNTREFLSHMHHLAEEHDVLEAARAYYAVAALLKISDQHLRAADRVYGTKLADDDAEAAEQLAREAKEILDKVEAKWELVRSVAN